MKLLVALMLATVVTSNSYGAEDMQLVRSAPVGPSLIVDQVASMEADAFLVKARKQVLIDGHLHYSGGFSRSDPSIGRLWVVFPDQVAELTPTPIVQDGVRYLEFNAAYEGVYPRGTIVDIVGEFTFKGGETRRIRVARRCLDVMLSAPLEAGERECNP